MKYNTKIRNPDVLLQKTHRLFELIDEEFSDLPEMDKLMLLNNAHVMKFVRVSESDPLEAKNHMFRVITHMCGVAEDL